MKKTLLILIAGIGTSAIASITTDLLATRTPKAGAVTPGVWHASLNKARDYAEANGLPLVAVWSNGDGCAHCIAFENCVMSPAFRHWMKDSGIVFYFGERGDVYDGQEGYHGTSFYWCCKNQNATMNWPYVRVWWPKGGVDACHSGAWYDGEEAGKVMRCSYSDNRTDLENFIAPGDYDTFNPGGRRIVSVLVGRGIATAVMPVGGGVADGGLLAGFDANTYAGGEFGFVYLSPYSDGGAAIEYGTKLKKLVVQLVRDEKTKSKATYNWLRTVYPNGRAETNKVEWAVGATTADAEVALDASWLVGSAKHVALELYSDKVELKDKSGIWCVEAVENSPANPLFVGERTKDSLAWGEWTMDAAVAMQKVADAGGSEGNAYVLVVCGGSLWCPDCANTDKNLFCRDEFKNWATDTHKVALVAIDIPNMSTTNPDGTSACLLTSVIGTPSADWRTAAGKDESGTYQCGVNYQTRHGVKQSDAKTIYERNKVYAAGLLNKLIPSNPYRPGVPTIYALRPDGTIAGRIAEFASTSPKSWNANYLTRLDELLALVDDKDEELNNGRCDASRNPKIAGTDRIGKTGTLSLADEVDVYSINAQAGSELMLIVTGEAAAKVKVSVVNMSDTNVVAETNGTLSAGVTISCTLPSSMCFARIATADGTFFKAAKNGSTVASYTIKTDSVIAPGEEYDELLIADCSSDCSDLGDSATNVWVKLEKGVIYRFKGLAEGLNAKALEYDGSTDLYTAKVDGRTDLVLVPDLDGKVIFGYQKWAPGVVEFSPKVMTVRERGDTEEFDTLCNISMRRTGGISGKAKVVISLVDDDKKSTRPADAYYWNDDINVRTFEWEEGDGELKTATVKIKGDTHADGATKLTFSLSPAEGNCAAVSKDEFVLTVIDDDIANPGRAALSTADGVAIPASRTVVAKGGTTGYQLGLVRVDGSDGPLVVKVMKGTTEIGSAAWSPREGTESPKTVLLDLPAYNAGGDNTLRLSIVGTDGAKVVADSKYLTISLIPEDAAMFSSMAVPVAMIRYVRNGETSVKLDGSTVSGGAIEIKKISGSIAPGMACASNDEGLVFSGTPADAGTYTAVYQVYDGGVAGGTVTVTMTVSDPVESEAGTPESNPSLAVTRTVSDIMVVNLEKSRLVGLLTVTVPRSGRLSGKYRSIDGTTVSLLSTEWDSCVGGDYVATMRGVQDDTYVATVTAKADGTISVDFDDPLVSDMEACLSRNSQWDEGDGAEAWKGYYTVSMPFNSEWESTAAFANGDGYVTLKMTDDAAVKSGRMAYAGILANGKAFSGVATLEALSDTAAILPMFSISDSDILTGVLKVDQSVRYREVKPHENAYPYWRHSERIAEASYAGRLNVYGCLYDQNELLKCCTNTFATQYLTFFALPKKLVDNVKFGTRASFYPDYRPVWSTNNIHAVAVKVSNEGGNDTVELYAPDVAKGTHGLTMSFNPVTGIMSGQLWLDFYETAKTGTRVTATYRGVVKPGWGKIPEVCNTCLDEPTPQENPFISGTCFFPDTYEYEYKMSTRWLQIKRGCPFSIGIEEGQ